MTFGKEIVEYSGGLTVERFVGAYVVRALVIRTDVAIIIKKSQ